MADGNILAGTPEVMSSFAAQGPVPPGPGVSMTSLMAEGAAFAARDQQANIRLSTFMSDADAGIRSYNSTAAASGRTYFEADDVSRAGFAVLQNPTMRHAVEGDPVGGAR
jgi:hypothetical protein